MEKTLACSRLGQEPGHGPDRSTELLLWSVRVSGQNQPSSSDITMQGLTVDAARSKWTKDFHDRTVRKDQVKVLGPSGEETDKMIWRLYVPVRFQSQSANYKANVTGTR